MRGSALVPWSWCLILFLTPFTPTLLHLGLKSQDPAVPEQRTFRAFSNRIIVCLFKDETEAILKFTKLKLQLQDWFFLYKSDILYIIYLTIFIYNQLLTGLANVFIFDRSRVLLIKTTPNKKFNKLF